MLSNLNSTPRFLLNIPKPTTWNNTTLCPEHPNILANLSRTDEGSEEVSGDAETYVLQPQRRHLRHHLLGLPQPESIDKQTV